MKKHYIKILLLSIPLFIILTFSSCPELDNLFKIPEARIVSVNITEVDFTSVSLEVNVEITNPNPVGITLNAYDYGLNTFGHTLLSGRIEETVSLRSDGKSIIPIPIEIEYENILSLSSSLKTAKTIPIGIKLGLEIAFPYMGGARLDVTGETEIPILRIPSLTAESIRVDKLTFSGAEISMSVNVQNPNYFPLSINSAEGRLLVSDMEWGEMGTGRAVKILPETDAAITLTMQIDFAEIGRSAWNLLTGGGKADINFEGKMDIDIDILSFSGGGIPFTTDAKVSILR